MKQVPSTAMILAAFEDHHYSLAYVTHALLRAVTEALERLDRGDLYGARLSLTMGLESYEGVADATAQARQGQVTTG